MDVQTSTEAKMRAVTISRQYGSGCGEIARLLAAKLGWRLVDHEIVVQLAHELGISEEDAETRDERAQSTVMFILNSLRLSVPALTPPLRVDKCGRAAQTSRQRPRLLVE